ncbi:unnamed protein product [Clonostachys solani]|uniref:Uncharacterized protein n=1 Tax=Clonostachys solani TaxID=160281 RepID=A0A9N9W4U6_9HYPO|nr:unnamed protein product [Clonostachys solani]
MSGIRASHSTLFSLKARRSHLNRIKNEQKYLKTLFDQTLLVTNPMVVAEADEIIAQRPAWTPQSDTLLFVQAQPVIRRLERWVPILRRRKLLTGRIPRMGVVVSAEHVVLFAGYMERLEQLGRALRNGIRRERDVQEARSELYMDQEQRYIVLMECRDRESGLRNCVSTDEV